VALGLKQMSSDPWEGDIPGRYQPGDLKRGKVTKLTNFGVFVELEPGLAGLLHISELADHQMESPEDVVKVGDEIEVKVLRVDESKRRVGLSRKQVSRTEDEGGEAAVEASARGGQPRGRELRGGTGSGAGQLFLPCRECGRRGRGVGSGRRSAMMAGRSHSAPGSLLCV
jgi:small subunit ribosomal protein S1